jgi:DNA polymerase-3 subunit gamma/tau
MRQILSLKYRPQTFDEIEGQEHIKNTLKKAIAHNKIANAYLFCGPRGVGKTTTARILASCLNCTSFPEPTVSPCGKCLSCRDIKYSRSIDVLEIDGASNRQIDDIRNLRENAKYAPVFSRYKIYIIDEVHMLTREAFNALLKTLEEPPPHVKFIFATTAPHKLPETIISRCQRFDFRKAGVEEIVSRLKKIAQKEGIKIEESALYTIARRSEGAIRDGEVLLDQIAAYSDKVITVEMVEEILDIIPEETFFSYFALLKEGDKGKLLAFLEKLSQSSYDPIEFYSGLIKFFRTLLLVKNDLPAKILGLSPEDYQKFQKEVDTTKEEEITRILSRLLDTEEMMRRTFFPEILLEVTSLKLLNRDD